MNLSSQRANAVNFDLIVPALRAGSRKQAFQDLAALVSSSTGLDAQFLTNRLIDRERSNPSGIGAGVAVAQARLVALQQPCLVLARLTNLVDFDAVDGQPVDLLALVLSPNDGPLHLGRLAKVTRLLRDAQLCRKLRDMDSADGIRALMMTNVEEHKQAA